MNTIYNAAFRGEKHEMDYYNAASVLTAHGASVELEDSRRLTPILMLAGSKPGTVKSMLLELLLSKLPQGFAARQELPPPHAKAMVKITGEVSLGFRIPHFHHKHAFSSISDFDTILQAVRRGEIDDLESEHRSSSKTESDEDDEKESRSIRSLVMSSTGFNTLTEEGSSLLHEAIRRGHEPWVRLFLSRGANPHIRNPPANFGGTTPLGCAVNITNQRTRNAISQALLNAGASPNVQDNEREAPIHKAASYYDVSLVKNLINAGAVVSLAGKNFTTALHELFEENANHTDDTRMAQKEVLKLLLEAGASVLAENEDERSAIELLFMSKSFDVFDEELVEAMVKDSFNRDVSYRQALRVALNRCTADSSRKKTIINKMKTSLGFVDFLA